MGALACLLAAAASGAEPATLVFPSGAELRGVLLGGASDSVRLEADGGVVELPADAVSEVRREPNAYAEFLARREAARTAAQWWELALWARERGLPGSARLAAERALAADPGHAGASAFLAPPPERRMEDPFVRAPAAAAPTSSEAALAGFIPAAAEPAELRAARLVAAELRRLGALRAPPVDRGLTRVVFFGRRFFPEEERRPQTGPAPWRPEPFRPAQSVLGLPPPEPAGARFGY